LIHQAIRLVLEGSRESRQPDGQRKPGGLAAVWWVVAT